ncbi:hypothetical protein J2W32_005407 [Variovorax boronicumulans]|uniref:Uncharacterized protein n=1 Tax=Variovorax boronicumulans TaxID=436515 RepID=A0AAW8D913_9BURK|nr:hypothetical protein [Variovorax boronicumulans]MDP9896351.1 hypothetical protein [Variovorax boronicumulans]MDQ0056339.1 hypothetical protein [Variovorax boronicumulans]
MILFGHYGKNGKNRQFTPGDTALETQASITDLRRLAHNSPTAASLPSIAGATTGAARRADGGVVKSAF